MALVALVSRLLQLRPAAKVLLLAPTTLRQQFVEQLRSAGIPALSVDRFQFREMLDSASEQELWPVGAVSVLSRDFARQEDVGEALGTTRWDLLIVDEAHQFRGAITGGLLRHVAKASDRIILATATSLSPDLLDEFAPDSTSVIEWRRDQIVDFNGALLDTVPRPTLRVVRFALSPVELSLAETVSELVRLLQAGTTQQHLIARSLLRSLQSSPAALESALARIREVRNRAGHAMEPLAVSSEEELLDVGLDDSLQRSVAMEAVGIASHALEVLEASSSDSKVGALASLLGYFDGLKTLSTRICVITEYVSTLFYLAAEIESRGQTCHVLHGGLNAEERRRTLSMFSNDGGILVATRAATSGSIALGDVTDLVFYDVPANPAALQIVLSGVDRFGRQARLNVHVLVPSNDVLGVATHALEPLGRIAGAPDSAHGEEWVPNT
jgi:hypothetical protein